MEPKLLTKELPEEEKLWVDAFIRCLELHFQTIVNEEEWRI